MTQAQFEAALAEKLAIPKREVISMLETVTDTVYDALKAGEPVVIRGLGRVKLVDRPARDGRNPQTGAKMRIKASRRLKILPAKTLKDRLSTKSKPVK